MYTSPYYNNNFFMLVSNKEVNPSYNINRNMVDTVGALCNLSNLENPVTNFH